MDASTGVGEMVVATEIPIQTFAGFDAKTGGLEGVKAVEGKVIVK